MSGIRALKLPRIAQFALVGAFAGGLSAGSIFVPTVTIPGINLLGTCIGIYFFAGCQGVDLGWYIFPGLIFGLSFAVFLSGSGVLRARSAAIFAAAATGSYALAVMSALAVYDGLRSSEERVGILAVAGVTAGAIGGGILARIAAPLFQFPGWPRLMAVGAGLGLLLSLWASSIGSFLFFPLWQAGYAGALAWMLYSKKAGAGAQ